MILNVLYNWKAKIAMDELIIKLLPSLTTNNVDINVLYKNWNWRTNIVVAAKNNLKLLPDKAAVVYPEVWISTITHLRYKQKVIPSFLYFWAAWV